MLSFFYLRGFPAPCPVLRPLRLLLQRSRYSRVEIADSRTAWDQKHSTLVRFDLFALPTEILVATSGIRGEERKILQSTKYGVLFYRIFPLGCLFCTGRFRTT